MEFAKRQCWLLVLLLILAHAAGNDFQITALDPSGQISWTNAFSSGVCTVEFARQLNGASPWIPLRNYFTTDPAGAGAFLPSPACGFSRLRAVEISTNKEAFTNLARSYGLLRTIAGSGADGGVDGVNYWKASFEGGYATNAALSRPHFAMADTNGNVFIVDKNSDSVLKVTADGRIHTVAGTHASGDGPDGSQLATSVALDLPNGLWVFPDGTVFVLDTGNNKVRRLDTNGMMTTIFADKKGMGDGRGLWVKEDQSVIYYCASTDLKQWTPNGGVSALNKKFKDLGNIFVNGSVIVATDRGDNTVWTVDANTGTRTFLYGNGGTGLVVDNTLAVTNGLDQVRGVWQPPIGGYFLATDAGAQFLYVDKSGIIHIMVNGHADVHAGDGQWFYSPTIYKFGQLRAVSMDSQGNLLIVENDLGYVRRIDFQRLTP
jgi:DNA-binding beta-propeller fold protein YncE